MLKSPTRSRILAALAERINTRARALKIALILWPAQAACAQMRGQPPNLVARFAGCYKIETTWLDSTGGPAIEHRVWFTTSQLADGVASRQVFAVRPAPREPASGFAASYWAPINDSTLMVVWSSGFNGVSVRVTRDPSGATWKGLAQTFSDVLGSPQKTGDVIIRSTSCD